MWLIALLMVLWGFLQGLAVGLVMAFCIVIYDLSRTVSGAVVRDALEFESSSCGSHSRVDTVTARTILQGLAGHVALIRPHGIIFFGSVSKCQAWFSELANRSEVDCIILDLRYVTYIDSSGLEMLQSFRQQAGAGDFLLLVCDADGDPDGGPSTPALVGCEDTKQEPGNANDDRTPARCYWDGKKLLPGIKQACAAFSAEQLEAHRKNWTRAGVSGAVQDVRCQYWSRNDEVQQRLPGTRQETYSELPLYFPMLDPALAYAENFLIDLHLAGAFVLTE